jgi:hypothetical protein
MTRITATVLAILGSPVRCVNVSDRDAKVSETHTKAFHSTPITGKTLKAQ